MQTYYVRFSKQTLRAKRKRRVHARGVFPFNLDSLTRHYFAVGIANSAPFSMLSGQRCMIDFCFV